MAPKMTQLRTTPRTARMIMGTPGLEWSTSKSVSVFGDGVDGEEGDDEVEEGDDRCVEEHEDEGLAVVEADAAVDPGTG